ncbi:phosphate signaling complex protein PhoU [Neobacillus sp. PS3-34]|uniref:phosphate signaling complex protein PhoU n=1 Tax=Neobacillus sp. PS3-34 TaxID=3070678 RepID=UPI0027E06166|nr:phosphate signaling complex protein PhoU [Neobacillus sp. PS3-34]WML47508.1 phosphate signaling complex protein PhoU [Neobacillus sp. PS3-34]
MSMRSNFDSNLKQLKEMLLDMAYLSEQAIKDAMDALVKQDLKRAEQIIEGDNAIDEMEHKIDDKAILMLATQSPVATDLRKVIVALKISSEVERIGDMAVNIAKSTQHIGNEKHIKEIVDIPRMMEMALEMLTDALTSFYTEDISLARKCAEKDDKVDEMYGRLVRELMGYIPENPAATNQITQLAFVCRFIERIADHATNIAENVIFLVTGKRYDLNA